MQRLQEVDFTELAQVIAMGMQQLNPSVGRRELLFKLSTAFTAAAVAPLFDALNPDELEQVTRAMQDPSTFDLHYYDDTRSAAHDAQNVELVTYILCTMSHLGTWQGKPRIGIDHAVAAAVWAEQSHSPLARAYAADVAIRAYVADNQPDKYRETLDREYAALGQHKQKNRPPPGGTSMTSRFTGGPKANAP